VSIQSQYLPRFKKILALKKIKLTENNGQFIFSHQRSKIIFNIPFDLIATQSQKVSAIIQSKLQLNKKIFARKCEVKKIGKAEADILAVCSFSKGRKMNRLPEHLRSFELIRFCTKEGFTITGGLTKIIKTFCREKGVGDIMTYVDKQFSSGDSFVKAGFVLHNETEPHYFLIHRKTFERTLVKEPPNIFNESVYTLVKSSGNLKMVYTP